MLSVSMRDAAALAADDALCWDAYAGARVAVTGATGLIGSALVRTLLAREEAHPTGMHVVALVRNEPKARSLFGETDALEVVSWDANDPFEGLQSIQADFVFHCANMTSSADFVERPVEVIETTLGGARATLELARRCGARLCLLSTMETYGEVAPGIAVTEDMGGFIDPMVVRNSYPEAKRLDEALAAAYAAEYGTRAVVVRLAQTFGPGVSPADGRVFAYFARCVREGRDIVLATDGSKRNSYLYVADAVSALLVACARGETGRAYNAANDATFCSVRQMAEAVAKTFGKGQVQVRLEIDPEAAKRFRKGSELRLDTSALEALGWTPKTELMGAYEALLEDWGEQRG